MLLTLGPAVRHVAFTVGLIVAAEERRENGPMLENETPPMTMTELTLPAGARGEN